MKLQHPPSQLLEIITSAPPKIELINFKKFSRLKVNGGFFQKLLLSEYPIAWLPNLKIEVVGDLNLRESEIKQLPNNLNVGGNLNLHWCIKLTNLPPNLIVKGTLDLKGSKIKELPHDLIVTGEIIWT